MVRLANRSPKPPPRRGQAGYTLVMLMVLVTVLNVLVAAALPAWTAMAQRDKEEELIFRGLQYAEAIRVFQSRFGRLPVRLEELVEVEPRSIRQLWKDPITGKNDWGVIFASAGGGAPQPGNPDNGTNLSGDSGLRPSDNGANQVTQGPIVGVFSRAKGDSIKTFNGKDTYSEWQFTVELLGQLLGGGGQAQPGSGNQQVDANGRPIPPPSPAGPGAGAGVPGNPGGGLLIRPGGGPPDLSSRWIGRPWPPEIQGLVNGSGPDQQQGQQGQRRQDGGRDSGPLSRSQ